MRFKDFDAADQLVNNRKSYVKGKGHGQRLAQLLNKHNKQKFVLEELLNKKRPLLEAGEGDSAQLGEDIKMYESELSKQTGRHESVKSSMREMMG